MGVYLKEALGTVVEQPSNVDLFTLDDRQNRCSVLDEVS